MALSDAEIKWAMVKSLESVIAKIQNHELPMRLEGTQVFANNGDFGDRETGETRYWLASVIVTPHAVVMEEIKTALSRSQDETLL